VIEMFDFSDARPPAEYCPHCGRGIEWVLRREAMVPRHGVVDQPFRFMPCGCFVNPDDQVPPRPRETWSAESP
jgi:hypothetical protein